MTTGKRAKKSSAGYDLTRLLIGSEGTLGIITVADAEAAGHPAGDLRRRLPVSERRGGLQCGHRHDPDGHSGGAHRAGQCAADAGDDRPIRSSTIPESPCLFVEFHGSDAGVAEQAETFGEIAAEFGGGPFLWTSVAEERTQAVEGPPRRLLVVADAAAGRQGPVDRRLRADLAACRMRRRDARPTSPRWG